MLYLLPESQFESVAPLFESFYPQRSIVLAVIERRIPGRVWVDRLESPMACLVVTNFVFAFCSGRISRIIWGDFLSVLSFLKNSVKLECSFGIRNELLSMARKRKAMLNTRIQFLYSPAVMRFNPSEIPDGLELKPITATTVSKCGWIKPIFLPTYSTTQKYLDNTYGFCLIDKSTDKVVSEAHAVLGDRSVTLGIMTHPEYRRMGFATLVCKKLIGYCLDRGLAIIWSSDNSNEGSKKLARKLGFKAMFLYNYVDTSTLMKLSTPCGRFFPPAEITDTDVSEDIVVLKNKTLLMK